MIKKAAITIVIISSAMIVLGMLLAFMGLVLGGNPHHALHNINIRDDYQYNFNKKYYGENDFTHEFDIDNYGNNSIYY